MKKFSAILIFLLINFSVFIGSAVNSDMDKNSLYVNDVLIDAEDGIINGILVEGEHYVQKDDLIVLENGIHHINGIFFPLRTIFEALGATVDWQEETGDIIIQYRGEYYLCYTQVLNAEIPSEKLFFIKKKNTEEYLYLNPMSMGGICYIINNRIYLSEDTGKQLFEALNCTVEIAQEMGTLKICDQGVSDTRGRFS